MRLEIHNDIAKMICSEIRRLGFHIHKTLFLFGNLFPDIIQSYIWCRHEYKYSREYIRKKINRIKNKPLFFSFHLGILAHYICDYFCYPHTTFYNEGFINHVAYEVNQKIPEKFIRLNMPINKITIEELDKYVDWFESFRSFIDDDESDYHIASTVALNFLEAAYLT